MYRTMQFLEGEENEDSLETLIVRKQKDWGGSQRKSGAWQKGSI